MSLDGLLTVFALLIAIYAIVPKEHWLDIGLRIRALDIMLVASRLGNHFKSGQR